MANHVHIMQPVSNNYIIYIYMLVSDLRFSSIAAGQNPQPQQDNKKVIYTLHIEIFQTPC